MSFATQEDVFKAIEYVMSGVFNEFSNGKKVDQPPFRRIPFRESMIKYGCDKPDLRNPLEITDATPFFGNSGFGVFDSKVAAGEQRARLLRRWSLPAPARSRALSLTSLTLTPKKPKWAAWRTLPFLQTEPKALPAS